MERFSYNGFNEEPEEEQTYFSLKDDKFRYKYSIGILLKFY